MKANRFLKAAVWLWALAVLTAATLPGSGSLARYAASAEGTASARVAKWWPFESYHEKDTTDDDGSGEAVLLIFKDADGPSQTATLYLDNRSEVTARYKLVADVASVAGMSEEDFLDEIMDSIEGNAGYDPDGGIAVQYGAAAELTVTIPAVDFTGLEIAAYAVQVD